MLDWLAWSYLKYFNAVETVGISVAKFMFARKSLPDRLA